MSALHAVPVTVCIPLFNKAALVERAVASALAQSHRQLEVVVVDDGSTDGGAEVVRQIRDPRIRLIEQPNRGPGAARNLAWRSGAGEVVAFLDADDFWDQDYVEWGVERLLSDATVAACTSGHRELTGRGVQSGNRLWPGREIRPGRYEATASTRAAELLVRLTYMFPVTTLVRRDVLVRYGGFFDRRPCTYGEDAFLWIKVLLNHPVYMDDVPRVSVDRTGSSLSTLATLASRPLDPLLDCAPEIRDHCPPALRPALDDLLAAKAFKRSCTLASVGRWREGRRLRSAFARPGSLKLPYGLASAVATTAPGSLVARLGLLAARLVRPE